MELSPEAQAQLAKLATDLAHNPKTRKKFAGLVQEIDPSRRFPDVEADDMRADMKKEFEKRDQEREAERVKLRLETQKESLRSRYDDSAIAEIEKLMEKKGISDYEDGAILYAAITKPATPTHDVNDHAWSLPKIDIKDFGNLKQRGRAQAYQAIDELNRKRA
jgi:hypothetical protein